MSPEQLVRRLADRAEIEELFNAYAEALDRRDWDGLEELFTEDAGSAWSAGFKTAGRAEFMEFVRRYMDTEKVASHTMFGSLTATVGEDVGEASVRGRVLHVGLADRAGRFNESNSRFDARLRRERGRWRFAHFEETVLAKRGGPEVFEDAASGS